MRAAIIMGSTSDLPKVEPAVAILKDYGVEVDVRCLSAHRAHAGLSAAPQCGPGNGFAGRCEPSGGRFATPALYPALFSTPRFTLAKGESERPSTQDGHCSF